MKSKILIFTATYNESKNITLFLKTIDELNLNADLLIVDDNSPDGTLEVLKKINYENLKIFSRKKTKGLASAFLLGLINTSGDIIGWLDSNMGDTAKKFPEMLQNLKGADIVILSRYVTKGKDERNKIRVIASYLLNKFSKLILRSKINDLSSGIFLMKREVLNDVVPVAKGHGEFMIEFLYKAEKKGNKIIEIPYIQPIDIEGHSKSFPNIAKFLYLGFFYLVRIIQSIITK